jgi:hypothetical protein
MNKMTLRDVLLKASRLKWDHALFLPPRTSSEWTLDTEGAVLSPDEREEGSETLLSVTSKGGRQALSIQDVQQIVTNARLQDRKVDPDTLLKAFLHYIKNDAFIDLKEAP